MEQSLDYFMNQNKIKFYIIDKTFYEEVDDDGYLKNEVTFCENEIEAAERFNDYETVKDRNFKIKLYVVVLNSHNYIERLKQFSSASLVAWC